MRAEVKKRYDTNQIGGTQYSRILRTIEQIEKYPIAEKMIDEITSDEIQAYLNGVYLWYETESEGADIETQIQIEAGGTLTNTHRRLWVWSHQPVFALT